MKKNSSLQIKHDKSKVTNVVIKLHLWEMG